MRTRNSRHFLLLVWLIWFCARALSACATSTTNNLPPSAQWNSQNSPNQRRVCGGFESIAITHTVQRARAWMRRIHGRESQCKIAGKSYRTFCCRSLELSHQWFIRIHIPSVTTSPSSNGSRTTTSLAELVWCGVFSVIRNCMWSESSTSFFRGGFAIGGAVVVVAAAAICVLQLSLLWLSTLFDGRISFSLFRFVVHFAVLFAWWRMLRWIFLPPAIALLLCADECDAVGCDESVSLLLFAKSLSSYSCSPFRLTTLISTSTPWSFDATALWHIRFCATKSDGTSAHTHDAKERKKEKCKNGKRKYVRWVRSTSAMSLLPI